MKHTPGPWYLNERSNIVAREFRAANGWERMIARPAEEETMELAYHPISREEFRANAKLMAAAPDMLYALKEFLAEVADQHENTAAMLLAKDAIAKAEGRQ